MSDWKNVQYKNGKYKTSEGGGGGSSTFAGLDDVSFANVQNGQVPKYNSTTQKWENADESGGGGTVTDVEVDGTSVVNQQTGVAEITMPNVPVQDVQVDGTSVVNAQGVAEITMPTPPTPDYPVTDVKVNGTSVVSNKQALITSYKEVTQAQYEALPSSKLSDGILYAIKDGGQAIEGFPPRIYSSEEREIGVWINGKPVYEKVIDCTEFSASANTWIDTGIDIPNGEYIVSCGFAQHNSISGAFLNIAFCKFDNSGNLLAYFADGTYYWSRCLIQYTKTTDTAGGGTWNQQGAIAHHYSTTEKVIGTWIDGKSVYEKTIPIDTISSASFTVNHGISNLSEVISINGFVKCSDSDGYFYQMLNDNATMNSNYYTRVGDINSTDFSVRFGTNRYSNAVSMVVILQYTKTTD